MKGNWLIQVHLEMVIKMNVVADIPEQPAAGPSSEKSLQSLARSQSHVSGIHALLSRQRKCVCCGQWATSTNVMLSVDDVATDTQAINKISVIHSSINNKAIIDRKLCP